MKSVVFPVWPALGTRFCYVPSPPEFWWHQRRFRSPCTFPYPTLGFLILFAGPSISLCLVTAPNNSQHLLQAFSKWVKELETEKGALKSTCLTGRGTFQVWDKWQLQQNLHKSCSLMRIHQAELLTNTQLQPFEGKVGTDSGTIAVSARAWYEIKRIKLF